MKKIYFLLVALAVTSFSFGQITELYISKYAEGSSNNKFLEIYNGTNAAISLDSYAFPQVSNAPTVPGEYEFWNIFPQGATIAAGDVFVIAHPSADQIILDQADMTFSFLSNGDDGVALVSGGTFNDLDNDGNIDAGEMTGFTIIDWLGDWNGDPGDGWEVAGITDATKNHTLTRKTSICGPNNNWDLSRGTTASDSEWIVGDIDTGWDALGTYAGCLSGPTLTIASPSNGSVINATTNVDLSFSVENFQIGATDAGLDGHIHYTIDGGNNWQMHYSNDPIALTVVPGNSYTVTLKLVDNAHNDIVPTVTDTVTFLVELPCELYLNAIETTCDAFTDGTDTYTTTIAFTGGGTAVYTLQVSAGTVGGDDPSAMAEGIITITGTPEGTDIVLTAVGDATTSCDITRNINSPACVNATCAGAGSIIVTEIMKNPSAVSDSAGEYFEVYNTTSTAIDMLGWVLKDADSNLHIVATSTIVGAQEYAVFGINADFATNGGVNVNYQYDGFNLSNGTDEVIIECSGTEIDAVYYSDTDFPDTTGASMELSTLHLDSVANDNGANWCDAIAALGTDFGTPGVINDCTATASVNDNQIAGFEMYPNPVKGNLNIITMQNLDKNVQIFNVLGKLVITKTITNQTINVTNLNAGIYLIKVTEAGKTVTRKLIIK